MMYNKLSLFIIIITNIISGIAQGLTIIIIPWYFTDTLNASSTFSFCYALLTIIGLFWGLYAGVIIDNFNRKKIFLYINFTSGIMFFLIFMSFKIFPSYSQFLMLLGFAICSFYYTISFPNLYALIQEITPKGHFIKITSILEIQLQLTSIIAALTCAVLMSGLDLSLLLNNYIEFKINKWEISSIFLLNSTMYLISGFILMTLKYRPAKKNSTFSHKNTFIELKEALLYLGKNKSIAIYGICSQIIFAFLIVELFSLLPLFVKYCLNGSILIFSLADLTYAIGAIISGIIMMRIIKKINIIYSTIVLIVVTGYAFLLMISFQKLAIFFIATLIIGMTNSSTRIIRMTYLLNNIPNYIIGRINTIFNSINTFIRAVLILLFSLPWFSENHNVIMGYRIGIVVLLLFSIVLLIEYRKTNQS